MRVRTKPIEFEAERVEFAQEVEGFMAMPGQWVLTNSYGQRMIVTADDFEKRFEILD